MRTVPASGLRDVAGPFLYTLAFAAVLAAPTNAQRYTGEVKAFSEIGPDAGGPVGALSDGARFGRAIARLPDVDGDGIDDLAVGAPFEEALGINNAGVVRILLLNAAGNSKGVIPLGPFVPELAPVAKPGGTFGSAIAVLGDVDGDGTDDIAVGSPGNGPEPVWILFMEPMGGVREIRALTRDAIGEPGLGDGVLQGSENNGLGNSLCGPGDIDGDGTPDLVIGVPGLGVFGPAPQGLEGQRLRVALLEPDGSIRSITVIEGNEIVGTAHGGATGFGTSVAALGDIDDDGVPDIVVGQPEDFDSSLWVLRLAPDGSVAASHEIGSNAGGLLLMPADIPVNFGRSVATIGDVDGDGNTDLAVTSEGYPFVGLGECLHVLLLDEDAQVTGYARTCVGEEALPGLASGLFGTNVAPAGDVNGDGVPDVYVGAPLYEDSGAVFALRLASNAWRNVAASSLLVSGVFTNPAPLRGLGTLAAGTALVLEVEDAIQDEPGTLVIGLNTAVMPFGVGFMVPSLDLALVGLPVDASGALTLSGVMPFGVPPGTTLVFQLWQIDDPNGLAELRSTNAMIADVP